MKKFFSTILAAVMISLSVLNSISFAYYSSDVSKFNNYTLTGNQAEDIANIAYAQLSKTGSQLGMSGAWCAKFVSDCARLAGISTSVLSDTAGASPSGYGLTETQRISKADAKKGDLVFWRCSKCTSDNYKKCTYCDGRPFYHVGIYYQNGLIISGNNSGKGDSLKAVVKKYNESQSGLSNVTALYYRPNYSASASNNAVERIEALKNLFPSGSFFSVNGKACDHKSSETCSNCNLVNILKRDDLKAYKFSDGGSWTCLGFAKFAWYFIHGKVWSGSYDIIINKGTPNKDFFSQAVPGDMIYYFDSSNNFRHAAIFCSASDTSAIVYHANTGGIPNKVNCGSWSYSSMASNYGSGSYVRLLRIKEYNSDKTNYSQISENKYFIKNGNYYISSADTANELIASTSAKLEFEITKDRDFYRALSTSSTGKNILNVNATNSSNGSRVTLWTDTTNPSQRWYFEECGGGYLIHPADNTALSLTRDTSTNKLYVKTTTKAENQIWTLEFATKYKVTFDANGGTGAPETQYQTHFNWLTLTSQIPTRKGYTFLGWSRTQNGSVDFLPGMQFGDNAPATLYAVWSANQKCVLSYNANGGIEPPSPVTCDQGTLVSISGEQLYREGYTFLGWSESKNATQPSYYGGDKIKLNADKTLYAVWEANNAELSQIILTIGSTKALVFGQNVYNDVAPEIVNGRTMCPVRFVAEKLGATVKWDGRVVITKGSTEIIIEIDSEYAYVNGTAHKLEAPAFIKDSRTYLPIRLICESLGATVEWDSVYRRVIITK